MALFGEVPHAGLLLEQEDLGQGFVGHGWGCFSEERKQLDSMSQ